MPSDTEYATVASRRPFHSNLVKSVMAAVWYPGFIRVSEHDHRFNCRIAEENEAVFEAGYYETSSGTVVPLAAAFSASAAKQVFHPASHEFDIPGRTPTEAGVIEIARDRSLAAGRRLVQESGIADTVVRNFANPHYPGGGHLGARSLRRSALAGARFCSV